VIREEIQRPLKGAVTPEANLLSTLAQLEHGYLVQQALEQEQEDSLGRSRYERRDEGSTTEQSGYRNGYEQGRLRTAGGEIGVRIPGSGTPANNRAARSSRISLRATPRLWSAWSQRCTLAGSPRGMSRTASGTPPEGYLSPALRSLRSPTGCGRIIRLSASGPLRDRGRVPLFLDTVYEYLRRYGAKEGVLCAWCIAPDGRKRWFCTWP
jgi:hypothetical protein